MAAHREIVTLAAKLQGMGKEANCIVQAVKVTLTGTAISKYAKCSIHLAPDDLPEGEYTVSFEGESVPVQKRDGHWLSWNW